MDADSELDRELRVCHPVRRQLEHLELARGEPIAEVRTGTGIFEHRTDSTTLFDLTPRDNGRAVVLVV